MDKENQNAIEVFYDGQCPICRAEIRFYGRIDRNDRILWTDIIALDDAQLPEGKSRSQLLGKFHVRELPAKSIQNWHVGVDAFARIWRELPGFKWFYWIFAVPGIRQLAKLAYLGFLRWQKNDRARRQTRMVDDVNKPA